MSMLQVDLEFGHLENASIIERSGVDATVGEESYVDTRVESASDTGVSLFANFKHFVILSDLVDHYYVGETT